MAMLAARHGHLHALCFLYQAQSSIYSDTAVSLQRVFIACQELHFLTSLRQERIIAVMSLLSGVNNARASSRACPSNGRDSCSESHVRSGRSPSVSSTVIIAICVRASCIRSCCLHQCLSRTFTSISLLLLLTLAFALPSKCLRHNAASLLPPRRQPY